MMIVVGGTIGSTLINYPLNVVMSVLKVVKQAFLQRETKPEELIKFLVELSNKARREGVLALEGPIKKANDKFMQNGFQLVIDGQEPEVTENVLNIEIENIDERHKLGAELFVTLGTLAPAYGMIGTLIGLVQMLQSMNDPSTIGPAMAVALITTFYGSLIANCLCLPIAGKLKTRSKNELLVKGLIAEAVLSIQAGDNPRIVEQKLHSFIAPKDRISVFDKR